MKQNQQRRNDLVLPNLSYQIIGVLFDVYNKLGYGHAEKVYQNAVSVALKECSLPFKEQLYSPILYKNQRVSINYFDFLIDDKIVLELKKGDRFNKAHIDQVYQYLKSKDLKLGILAYFAPRNLHFKRIVNL